MIMTMLDYLEFTGTTEGALKGWEERARRYDSVATKYGYKVKGGIDESGKRRYRHSSGRELSVNLNTGGWKSSTYSEPGGWEGHKDYGADTLERHLDREDRNRESASRTAERLWRK